MLGLKSNEEQALFDCLSLIEPSSPIVPECSLTQGQVTDTGLLFTRRNPRHILVLDLDETLVHVAIPPSIHQLPRGVEDLTEYLNTKLSIRPHLAQFLQAMSTNFAEVVLFTAAQQEYAECVLKLIDPQGKIFARKFFRNSCTLVGNEFKKDLRKVTDDLSTVVLVDNTPSVMMQPSNGYPVLSFNGDPCDRTLVDLEEVLVSISTFEDIRLGVQLYKEKHISMFDDIRLEAQLCKEKPISMFNFLPELSCTERPSPHSKTLLSQTMMSEVPTSPLMGPLYETTPGTQPFFGWALPVFNTFA